MARSPTNRWLRLGLALAVLTALTSCASLVDKASANLGRQLSAGILDHDDPATVAARDPVKGKLGVLEDAPGSYAKLRLDAKKG